MGRSMSDLCTYLALGRVSNLSTVWSNVLCAWIICGGQSAAVLASLLVGASLLYTAGMFMNDACDAEFDAVNRPERPIPSGGISLNHVRLVAAALAVIGFLCIAWTGLLPAALSLGLIALIALYNFFHKNNPLAPLTMAACRAALYFITAATVAHQGIDNLLTIAAGVMFVYVCGVTFLARQEHRDGSIDYAGLVLMLAPLFAAFYFRLDLFDAQRGIAIGVLGAWIGLSFLKARAGGRLVVVRTIGPLLAAIPLVDLLTLSSFGFATAKHLAIFAGFFIIAVFAQRAVAAS